MANHADLGFRSLQYTNFQSKRRSPLGSVQLRFSLQCICVFDHQFVMGSTSSQVIYPTWVSFAGSHLSIFSCLGVRMWMLRMTPCYCNTHNSQYVKQFSRPSLIPDITAAMSSAKRGMRIIGVVGQSFCSPPVTPLSVHVKSIPCPTPGARPFMCSSYPSTIPMARSACAVLFCFCFTLHGYATTKLAKPAKVIHYCRSVSSTSSTVPVVVAPNFSIFMFNVAQYIPQYLNMELFCVLVTSMRATSSAGSINVIIASMSSVSPSWSLFTLLSRL